MDRATAKEKQKAIANKITSMGGTIKTFKLEGRNFVWSVSWKDGTESEVRYGF